MTAKTGFTCVLVVFLLAYLHLHSFGQNESEINSKDSFDTLYVKDYSHLLAIKFYGVTKSNEIQHIDRLASDYLEYKPNEKFNIGVGFNYRWLGLDLAFNFPFVNNDDHQYGRTDRFDIQSNIYTRKIAADFNIQHYTGYYNTNPELYLPGWTNELPYPQRRDLQTTAIGLNALHVFKNEKFSYRATFIFNERQKKSAGSWLAGAYLSYFTFNADSTLVPVQLVDFNQNIDFRGSSFTLLGVSGGYTHTFVIGHKFFFSITSTLGLGPEFRSSPQNRINPNSKTSLSVKFSARSAIGFNSDKTFFGITNVYDGSQSADVSGASLLHSLNNTRIFFGKRFDAPKFKKT